MIYHLLCESNSIDRVLVFQARCCWFKPASRSNFSFIFICLPVGQSDLGRLTWAEEYRWFESNQVDHFCKFTIKRLFKFSLNILLLFVYFHFKNVIF